MNETAKIPQLSSLVCAVCGQAYEPAPDAGACPKCGGILEVTYDYDFIRRRLRRAVLAERRGGGMWRYRELLPVSGAAAEAMAAKGLAVGGSPLYESPRLAKALGLDRLWIKDDGVNPTASLKDRASAMAVAKAREAGAKIIACSSTGNAASSLACLLYTSRCV